MHRAGSLSPTDRYAAAEQVALSELVAAALISIGLVAVYAFVIVLMRTVLALGWYAGA